MDTIAPTSLRSFKIMLVEQDPRLLEMLVESCVRHFDAHLTCVASGEDALDVAVVEPHDIVVAELDLPCMDGLTLTQHLMELSDRPVILLADEPATAHAIEAMRLGARDLFSKPFAIGDLLGSMERALRRSQATQQMRAKHVRMRQLVRRVIRERRNLNQRIDLVCRDLVGAHRRLVHRVLAHEQTTQSNN
jgi:DNA-binding response OmpR family regulator